MVLGVGGKAVSFGPYSTGSPLKYRQDYAGALAVRVCTPTDLVYNGRLQRKIIRGRAQCQILNEASHTSPAPYASITLYSNLPSCITIDEVQVMHSGSLETSILMGKEPSMKTLSITLS